MPACPGGQGPTSVTDTSSFSVPDDTRPVKARVKGRRPWGEESRRIGPACATIPAGFARPDTREAASAQPGSGRARPRVPGSSGHPPRLRPDSAPQFPTGRDCSRAMPASRSPCPTRLQPFLRPSRPGLSAWSPPLHHQRPRGLPAAQATSGFASPGQRSRDRRPACGCVRTPAGSAWASASRRQGRSHGWLRDFLWRGARRLGGCLSPTQSTSTACLPLTLRVSWRALRGEHNSTRFPRGKSRRVPQCSDGGSDRIGTDDYKYLIITAVQNTDTCEATRFRDRLVRILKKTTLAAGEPDYWM